MTDTERKSCPFCGDQMELWQGDQLRHINQGDCILGSMGFVSLPAWNTRTPPKAETTDSHRIVKLDADWQWQDISTAPTDVEILVKLKLYKNEQYKNVLLVSKDMGDGEYDWRTSDDNSRLNYDWEPTYWLHIPTDLTLKSQVVV